nr:MAG TPA: hypothetical protein [Caudoviricetes sp.]
MFFFSSFGKSLVFFFSFRNWKNRKKSSIFPEKNSLYPFQGY